MSASSLGNKSTVGGKFIENIEQSQEKATQAEANANSYTDTGLALKADKTGTYASLRAQATTKADVGLSNVDNTSDSSKPVSTAQQTALNAKEDNLPSGTSSEFLRGNDKTFVTVTKANVGLSNVDNTSDANKPVSTAQQTELDAKEDNISSGTTSQYWRGDKSWQSLTKASVGLSNVDNTSDSSKPVSTTQQTALDTKEDNLPSGTSTQFLRGSDKTFVTVSKSNVGLGNVDNTSDSAKPVSAAQQTALDLKADQNGTYASLRAQATTKDDVGLGTVDNKSSATIRGEITSTNVTDALTYTPISNSLFNAYDAANGDFDTGLDHIMLLCPAASAQNVLGTLWIQRTSGHRGLTKIDILYGTGTTSTDRDAQLHVTQGSWNMGVFTIEIFDVGGTDYIGLRRQGTRYFITEARFFGKSSYTGGLFCTWYTTPAGTTNIPSSGNTDIGNSLYIDGVRKDDVWDAKVDATGTYANLRAQATTKDDVGLGNVDNDSTSTIRSGTTKENVGLGNVDNTSDSAKPVSTAQQTALDLKENNISSGTTSQYWRGDKSWQALTKSSVGLGSVDNTSDSAKPVSTAQQTALDLKEDNLPAGTSTQFLRGSDKTFVTVSKSNVGLGNADNTSDAAKPVSTAQQTALDLKEDSLPSGTSTQFLRGSDKTFVTVSKGNVGLGNVDNTSDTDKPVSTSQQTALDLKENSIALGTTSQYWRGDKSWQALTKSSVGLGNVEDKSSATIRGELTSGNVTSALTYTPVNKAGDTVTGALNINDVITAYRAKFKALTDPATSQIGTIIYDHLDVESDFGGFDYDGHFSFGMEGGNRDTVALKADGFVGDRINALSSSGLIIGDVNSNGLHVADGGDIGIGTSTPHYILDVAEDMRVREDKAVKFGGTGASDYGAEIRYNAAKKCLNFNFAS